jgi:uncharacterized UBP type Zn finger protein
MEQCTHVNSVHVKHFSTHTRVCKECVAMGDTWVHLRMCLECGHVGCCDQSKNQHARKHFESSHHPIIRSAQPDENWAYCYVDDVMVGSVVGNTIAPFTEEAA